MGKAKKAKERHISWNHGELVRQMEGLDTGRWDEKKTDMKGRELLRKLQETNEIRREVSSEVFTEGVRRGGGVFVVVGKKGELSDRGAEGGGRVY